MKFNTIHLVEDLDDSYGGPSKSVTHLARCLSKDFNQELISVKFEFFSRMKISLFIVPNNR